MPSEMVSDGLFYRKEAIMAKAKQQIILGIEHEILDEETDVSTTFHVLRHLSIDVANNYHIVSLDSYARQRTYERGGRAVGSIQFNLTGQPPRGTDLFDWVYKAIVMPSAENAADVLGRPAPENSFTGATLVYADLPEPVQPAE